MKRVSAEVAPGLLQCRDVLQKVGVTDAVVRVDSEAETTDELRFDRQSLNGGEARHVFGGRTETRLVSTHENIRAAIDQNHRVEVQGFGEITVRFSQRPNANLLESVHIG